MRLTTYELKKSIATRLLAAWALLSIVLGIGSYYFESKQIDAFVFSLAAQAAKHFNNPENEVAFLGNLDQHRSLPVAYHQLATIMEQFHLQLDL